MQHLLIDLCLSSPPTRPTLLVLKVDVKGRSKEREQIIGLVKQASENMKAERRQQVTSGQRESVCVCVCVHVSVHLCVSVYMRVTSGERQTDRESV